MTRTAHDRTLTHDEARGFYDRFAWLQEWQAFYESSALEVLVKGSGFASARSVVEIGCGTGRLAERLLARELPAEARYLGLDISAVMVERTRGRLAPFGPRASVRMTDGSLRLPAEDASVDRVVAAYVLDLLSGSDIRLALEEAHRVLVPGGRLCLACLSSGTSLASRALCRIWTATHALSPALVGGCRPIDLSPLLGPERWEVATLQTVVAFAVPTQVAIAFARSPRAEARR